MDTETKKTLVNSSNAVLIANAIVLLSVTRYVYFDESKLFLFINLVYVCDAVIGLMAGFNRTSKILMQVTLWFSVATALIGIGYFFLERYYMEWEIPIGYTISYSFLVVAPSILSAVFSYIYVSGYKQETGDTLL